MKKYILISCICLLNFQISAQQNAASKLSVIYYPQYHQVNGLKISFLVPLQNSKYQLGVAPIIYNGLNNDFDQVNPIPKGYATVSEFDNITGWGVDLICNSSFLKIDPQTATTAFCGIGFGYHSLNYEFEEYRYRAYIENDMEFTRYTPGVEKEELTRFDTFFILGVKTNPNKLVSLEMTAGPVYRFGKLKSTLNEPRPDDPFNYRRMGLNFRFTAGICLNIPLKKL